MKKVSRRAGETVKRRGGETEIGGKITDSPIPRFPGSRRRGFTQHHFWLKSGAGFSLIELMVVVVIIGIVIGGALFFGQGTYRRTSVKNAARDVASLMRMAHSKALGERTYYNLVIDLDNEDCYLESLDPGDDGVLENIVIDEVVKKDYAADNPAPVRDSSPGAWKRMPKVVDIDNVNGTNSGEVRITFTFKETVVNYLNPPATTNYSVYLDDKATGSVRYMVVADCDTARVKIYSSW